MLLKDRQIHGKEAVRYECYNKQRARECEWFISNNHDEAVLNIQMMVTVDLGVLA